MSKERTETLMHNKGQIRRRGWILVGLGSLLAASMAALLIVVTPIILLPSPDRTTRFSGDTQDALLIFSILYLVLVFGLASILAGILQIRSGHRSRNMTFVMVVFGLMLYGFGMVIYFLL